MVVYKIFLNKPVCLFLDSSVFYFELYKQKTNYLCTGFNQVIFVSMTSTTYSKQSCFYHMLSILKFNISQEIHKENEKHSVF